LPTEPFNLIIACDTNFVIYFFFGEDFGILGGGGGNQIVVGCEVGRGGEGMWVAGVDFMGRSISFTKLQT
jgi:hypothetical protein